MEDHDISRAFRDVIYTTTFTVKQVELALKYITLLTAIITLAAIVIILKEKIRTYQNQTEYSAWFVNCLDLNSAILSSVSLIVLRESEIEREREDTTPSREATEILTHLPADFEDWTHFPHLKRVLILFNFFVCWSF